MNLSEAIQPVLAGLDRAPVLVDIGASGQPPAIWLPLATSAIYVGFDPDQRELSWARRGPFARETIMRKAVSPEAGQRTIRFNLTASPQCSSILAPDLANLDAYLFADLFRVVSEATVPAVTLTEAVNNLGLKNIDWLKIDSQGTDLRLFNSLDAPLRNQVLAVDIEPGLIDAYVGEDLFVDAHRNLVQQGFWLSNLELRGAARMRRTTLGRLDTKDAALLQRSLRPSPGWCEARYLRSLDWLMQHAMSADRYQLLWIFALMDQQYGFALDLAQEYRRNQRSDAPSDLLQSRPLMLLYQTQQNERRWGIRVTRKLRAVLRGLGLSAKWKT